MNALFSVLAELFDTQVRIVTSDASRNALCNSYMYETIASS